MEEQRVVPRAESRPRQWWRSIRVAALAVGLTLVIVFFAQNFNDTDVSFLAWDFTVHLSWLILVAVVVGILLGFLLPRLRRKSV